MEELTIKLEAKILGAMLNNIDIRFHGINELQEHHFNLTNNKVLFLALCEAYKLKQNELFDILNILERNYTDSFQTAYEYIFYCSELSITDADFNRNIELLKEKFLQREAGIVCYDSYIALAKENQDPNIVIQDMQSKLNSLTKNQIKGGLTPFDNELEDIYKDVLENKVNPNRVNPNIVKSGFAILDTYVEISPEKLIIIAARPGMGKSALVTALSISAQKQNKAVAFFSLEMSRKQVTKRVLAIESDINFHKMKHLSDDRDLTKLENTIDDLKNCSILIDDTPKISPDYIRLSIRKAMIEYPNIGLIVVDYLQLMDIPSIKDRLEKVSEITRELKNIARELKLPVIALAQLSREVEKRSDKRPMLSDLRESGELEQSADIVLFVYRDEYYNPKTDKKRIAEIIIAKNREGELGKVETYFDGSLTKFADLERV